MRRTVVVTAVGCWLGGCSLLVPIDDGVSGGSVPGEAGSDSSTTTHALDGATSALEGGEASAPGCGPTKGGPSLVRVDLGDGRHYCIDRTEVTERQYGAFLATASTPTHPRCRWKTSFQPAAWSPSDATAEEPVVGVDWCDAYEFCAWSGQQLCGSLKDSPLTVDLAGTADVSMVAHACSAGGTRSYPYGNAFDGTKCNGAARDAGDRLPVASLPGCEGGFPGIFDLVGNVIEWMDACEESAGDGADDVCAGFNSPSYEESPEELTCSFVRLDARNKRWEYTGFRCCGR